MEISGEADKKGGRQAKTIDGDFLLSLVELVP